MSQLSFEHRAQLDALLAEFDGSNTECRQTSETLRDIRNILNRITEEPADHIVQVARDFCSPRVSQQNPQVLDSGMRALYGHAWDAALRKVMK